VPIPALTANGELPPGEHPATMSEIETAFGNQSDRRKSLMTGLKQATENFTKAKVRFIFVDGSFATNKPEPNDIDGCWSGEGDVDFAVLDPVFWDISSLDQFKQRRQEMKAKYSLDFFIAELIEADSGEPFSSFFQSNRDGERKGILKVTLNSGGRS
jgi:hypothetical protein